jgi:cytochrome c
MKGDASTLEAPPLYAIIGRKAGATAFSYSKAMKRSGIVWDDTNLFKFLGNPRRLIPANRMAFGGLASAQKRADLIAFLREYDPFDDDIGSL